MRLHRPTRPFRLSHKKQLGLFIVAKTIVAALASQFFLPRLDWVGAAGLPWLVSIALDVFSLVSDWIGLFGRDPVAEEKLVAAKQLAEWRAAS